MRSSGVTQRRDWLQACTQKRRIRSETPLKKRSVSQCTHNNDDFWLTSEPCVRGNITASLHSLWPHVCSCWVLSGVVDSVPPAVMTSFGSIHAMSETLRSSKVYLTTCDALRKYGKQPTVAVRLSISRLAFSSARLWNQCVLHEPVGSHLAEAESRNVTKAKPFDRPVSRSRTTMAKDRRT